MNKILTPTQSRKYWRDLLDMCPDSDYEYLGCLADSNMNEEGVYIRYSKSRFNDVINEREGTKDDIDDLVYYVMSYGYHKNILWVD